MVSPDPERPTQSDSFQPGNAWAYTAMVFGLLAVLVTPVIFGGIGLIVALFARSWGAPLWRWSLAVVILGTVVGLALTLVDLGLG